MTFEAWALFCATEFMLCLNPGPSTLLVISLGMTRGQLAGIAATSGVLAANALYFGLSATGLAVALAEAPQLFVAIRWLGAAFLVWTGVRMIAVLSAYSALSHRAGRRATPSLQRGISRLGGALLIAAGAGLAALGRAGS